MTFPETAADSTLCKAKCRAKEDTRWQSRLCQITFKFNTLLHTTIILYTHAVFFEKKYSVKFLQRHFWSWIFNFCSSMISNLCPCLQVYWCEIEAPLIYQLWSVGKDTVSVTIILVWFNGWDVFVHLKCNCESLCLICTSGSNNLLADVENCIMYNFLQY